MTTTMGTRQWFKGKGRIVEDYDMKSREIVSAICSRGFDLKPGFLFLSSRQMELALKQGLSDLNYNIMSDAIERELRSQGIGYDVAFKEAQIAFQLSKASLLTELEKEFSRRDKDYALSENTIMINMIEQEVRQAVIIAYKTETDRQIEIIKQELFEIEALSRPYEEDLLKQKLYTAQTKMNVIPYLEQIIQKNLEMLGYQEKNNELYRNIAISSKALSERRKDTLPGVYDDQEQVLLAIADSTRDWLEDITERGYADKEMAKFKKDLAKSEQDFSLKLDEKRIKIKTKRDKLFEFNIRKDNDRIEALRKKLEDITEYATTLEEHRNSYDQLNEQLESLKFNFDIDEFTNNMSTEDEVEDIKNRQTIDELNTIAEYQNDATKETAEISAKATLTSNLIHFIAT